MVSLMQIVEDFLRISPRYKEEWLSLYIPDSLLEKRIVFRSKVVLYVSRHNPGVLEAAAELQDTFGVCDIAVTGSLHAAACSRKSYRKPSTLNTVISRSKSRRRTNLAQHAASVEMLADPPAPSSAPEHPLRGSSDTVLTEPQASRNVIAARE
eukprot:787785-Prymnesium_polylepis.1